MRREAYERLLQATRVAFLQLLEERDPLCHACDDFGWVYDKASVGRVFCKECNWPKPPPKPTRYDMILERDQTLP